MMRARFQHFSAITGMKIANIPAHISAVVSVLLLAFGITLTSYTTAVAQQIIPPSARKVYVMTLYQNDVALIEDVRFAPLRAGANILRIEGIQDLIPDSLNLMGGAGVSLRSQTLYSPNLTHENLLRDYIGQEVLWIHTPDEGEGEVITPVVLLAFSKDGENAILQLEDRIELTPGGRLAIPNLLQTANIKSTLELVVESEQSGGQDIAISYLVNGLSWYPDYIATYNAGTDSLELSGYANLSNTTHTTFQDIALRLVAGEVRPPSQIRPLEREEALKSMTSLDKSAQNGPRPMADRHLFDTGERLTLTPDHQNRIALFPARSLLVDAIYIFPNLASPPSIYGSARQAQEVYNPNINLSFINEQGAADGGDIPLPGGQIRVYSREEATTQAADPIAAAIFLGADTIRPTPPGTEVEITLGSAFDITARKEVSTITRMSDTLFEVDVTLVIENAKDKPIEAEVNGFFPPGWSILEESVAHEKKPGNEMTWNISVPPGAQSRLIYKARYQQ